MAPSLLFAQGGPFNSPVNNMYPPTLSPTYALKIVREMENHATSIQCSNLCKECFEQNINVSHSTILLADFFQLC